MSKQVVQAPQYMVSVYEDPNANQRLIFTFVPKRTAATHEGTGPQRNPEFIVAANKEPRGLVFDWSATRDDPGSERKSIESEVLARIQDRFVWIDRVNALVIQIEEWASEMGWATRRVEKNLDDARIGKHRLPALLMQEGTCRVLLEPVGRSTPGAQGVVDLYLMPAYDDIASIYYYNDQWNLHYMFPGTESVATIRDAASLPLSKETLGKVLAEMRHNAA